MLLRVRLTTFVAVIGLVAGGACTDSRDPVAPAATPNGGASTGGSPTGQARAVLSCVATVAGSPVVTCTPFAPNASRRHGAISATDVFLGRQNLDVKLTFSNFSYNQGSGLFQFNATVTNLLNQPMGTTDGTHPTATQVEAFFYTLPAVTHGVGTVTVSNPDGTANFTQSQAQPYFRYNAPLAPGATSPAKTWKITLTGSVTGFNFAVEVDAALPAEKSIRRWVTLRQGLTGDSLTGVWQRSATDVWAVGTDGTVLNYNGTTWSTISPSGPLVNYRAVSGLAGASVPSVWVVGDNGATAHDSNSTWTAVPGQTTANLLGVWVAGAGNVYAAGSNTTILHYTGGAWGTMAIPHGVSSTLQDIWGTDTSHVWTVGTGGTILFNNGTNWSKQTSGTNQTLTGVWGDAATDVFAVGARGTILHYDGTRWSTMVTGSTGDLMSVGGSGSSNVWAVGASGTTLHYDGTQWSVVGPHVGMPLSSVTSGSGNPWAVGAEGSLVSYDGSRWQVSTQSGLSLNGVWANSASDVWVATLGTALHYDGTNWSNAYIAPGDSMTSIWGTAATPAAETVYVVGANGSVAYYSAGSWTALGTPYNFYHVWGSSSTNVYAVGQNGLILHWNTGVLTPESPGGSASVLGIWGSSSTQVFAVSSKGNSWHSGGTATWSSYTSNTTDSLNAVFGSALSDVYAVGRQGTILHYNGVGTSWTPMNNSTKITLLGAWADAPPSGYTADAYAVGASGTVLHYNGSAWLSMPTPSGTSTLRSIWGTSASNLYVVGDNGTVLLGTQ